MSHELALVMPVYNEEACIARVVSSWADELARLGIDFRMIVLNDGSKDRTREELERFDDDPRIQVVHKPNSGHGPTILQGYRQAVREARWVFQIDSDDELKPDAFEAFWNERENYDALFAIRENRVQAADRRLISAVSRLVVRALFGSGVRDVNVPFRLIRAPILARIIDQLPNGTLTPNVIISGAVARAGARILNRPVRHAERETGVVSLGGRKLWKFAVRAFWQCLRCRPRLSPSDLQQARTEETA